MSSGVDWVPDNNDELKTFGATMYTNANANKLEWHLITERVTDLLAKKDAYESFLLISNEKTTRNELEVEDTDGAKAQYKSAIRHMGQDEMKHNIYMTNTNRTSCGVPNDSATHEHAPIADTSPAIDYSGRGRLGGNVHHSPTLKDEGQMGIKVKIGFYKKGDPIPTEAQCTQTEILGTINGHVVYEEAHYDDLLVGYARYLNNRKQVGTVATQFFGVVS